MGGWFIGGCLWVVMVVITLVMEVVRHLVIVGAGSGGVALVVGVWEMFVINNLGDCDQ